MKTYAELEAEYLALCEMVVKSTRLIVGFAGAGRADDAGRAAVNLMDIAGNAKQRHLMQGEQSGGYDLSALRVDAATASNSETGWERED